MWFEQNSTCGEKCLPFFYNILERVGFVSERRLPGSLAVEWHLGPQASLCSPHSETWRNTYFQHISSYNLWDLFSNPLEDLLLEKRDLHPRHLPPISAAHRSENRRSPGCPADKKGLFTLLDAQSFKSGKRGRKFVHCTMSAEQYTTPLKQRPLYLWPLSDIHRDLIYQQLFPELNKHLILVTLSLMKMEYSCMNLCIALSI